MDNLSKEKRWLVIIEDGRHSTLGRATDPTSEEIDRAAAGLDASGLAGWLAVSEGTYYRENPVKLLLVRRITMKDGSWDEAERLWHAARAERLTPG
jgi:hypothetical protein